MITRGGESHSLLVVIHMKVRLCLGLLLQKSVRAGYRGSHHDAEQHGVFFLSFFILRDSNSQIFALWLVSVIRGLQRVACKHTAVSQACGSLSQPRCIMCTAYTAKMAIRQLMRKWCSGIIVASHATDRGSIPRLRNAFCFCCCTMLCIHMCASLQPFMQQH